MVDGKWKFAVASSFSATHTIHIVLTSNTICIEIFSCSGASELIILPMIVAIATSAAALLVL